LIPKLAKTQEKKLTILALSSLLGLPLVSLPAVVQHGMKQILDTIIHLEFELEEQKLRIDQDNKLKELEEDQEENELDEELSDNDDDDEAENPQAFVNMVQKAQQLYSDAKDDEDDEEEGFDDEDFDEVNSDDEDEFASPIDVIDEMIYFVDHMKGLASSDNASYQKLYGQLDENGRAMLQDLASKAELRRAELARLQQEKLQQQQQ